MIGALLVFSACKPGGPSRETAGGAPLATETPVAPLPARTENAHPADRCGECHGAIFAAWKTSRHGRARTSPLYQAMRAAAHDEGCETCHAPLANLVAPDALAIDEGVTCEVCHAIEGVNEQRGVTTNVYVLADSRKRGPLCDARDHYFHKMGCSPLHREARVCAGCHGFSMPLSDGASLPVFTDQPEWARSSYAATGIPCQDCHMPTSVEPVATGTARKARVGHHGFMGAGGDLLRRALRMDVAPRARTGGIAIDVTLKNEGAGHAVPAGMPGRQIVVRARLVDTNGAEIAQQEQALGRVLVDEAGHEAPFYAARKEAADERIAAGASRKLAFSLDTSARAGAITVELVWRSLAPAIAAAIGVPAEETSFARAHIPFDLARPLKTVTVQP